MCNSDSINFRAKFIDKVQISKRIADTSIYKDVLVSCVKINPKNVDDIKALENISKCWEDSKFATNIYYAACAIRNDSKYYKCNNIYAITTQNSNFNNINYKNILGLVHTCSLDNGDMFIEHLEADPKIVNSTIREYKKIGTSILDCLKIMAGRIVCFPSNTKTVKNFYFSNGFLENPPHSNLFIWTK